MSDIELLISSTPSETFSVTTSPALSTWKTSSPWPLVRLPTPLAFIAERIANALVHVIGACHGLHQLGQICWSLMPQSVERDAGICAREFGEKRPERQQEVGAGLECTVDRRLGKRDVGCRGHRLPGGSNDLGKSCEHGALGI
ncbi:MAG TPA: hypothetical protein VLA00_06090 [Xanthobacteraceae bacterium]|nr:hypothetical protein [Xanthobacteraceae bacterium]